MASFGSDVVADILQVKRLAITDTARFRMLCHMHLSFVLDLDGSSLADILSEDKCVKKSHSFKHFGKKKSKVDQNEMPSPQLDSACREKIEVLIRFLDRPEKLKMEGLFRKSGHLGRQRVLRGKLMSGDTLEAELSSGVYTAHDCANLLKTFLGELAEPLLTKKHFSIYYKIPDMVTSETFACDRKLLQKRQMATAQLLVQLLRWENAALLQALLTLLQRVAHTPGNLMTSETLGTMFAPHLLIPRRMSASDQQKVMMQTSRAVAFLIEHVPEVFKVPAALMRDVVAYSKEVSQKDQADMDGTPCNNRYRKHLDDDVLQTTVTFVDRQALQGLGSRTDTQVEVAQLYAHIGSMPESAKKQKLLKQFNRVNGIGTPKTARRRKRSKSLSESLKKMVGRNNHNQCDGISMPSNAAEGLSSTVRGAHLDSKPSPAVKAQHPSNARVHIVDLKVKAPVLLRNCKRHLDSPTVFRTPRCTAVPARTMVTPARRQVENSENVEPIGNISRAEGRWTAHGSKLPHAPVIVTPDRCFGASSSMTKGPLHMKVKSDANLQFCTFDI